MAQQLLLGARRLPLPETYFHLGGGGFGGPIIRNRTFFWAASKATARTRPATAPCGCRPTREKAGDFSQTFDTAGQLDGDLRPADRRCHRQRPHAVPRQHHPGRTASTRCRATMPSYLPSRDTRRQQRQRELRTASREIKDRAIMYTGKVDHRFSDTVSLSGLLPLQQDRRAVRQLLGARADRRQPLRRPRRLHPAAPRPHARA